jgi:hypothetical protein
VVIGNPKREHRHVYTAYHSSHQHLPRAAVPINVMR